MRYRIDSMSLRGGELIIDGWSFGENEIRCELKDREGHALPASIVQRDRADVMKRYGAPLMCGFTVKAPFDREQEAFLCLTDGRHKRSIRINGTVLQQRNEAKKTKLSKLRSMMEPEKLANAMDFLRENGIRAFMIKTKNKLRDTGEDYDYAQWERLTAPDEKALSAQRESWKALRFNYDDGFSLGEGREAPLISIVIPAFNTPKKYLRMLFDSLKAQTYPLFEVIVADGSEGDDSVRELTGEYIKKDARFRYVEVGGNKGISGNTNAGLCAASGDYIALCDHDDELPPYALYELMKAVSRTPKGLFFYTDEDKVDFDGRALFEPHFKPDYDPELLLTVNYICHLCAVRRDLMEAVGGFQHEFDGAQDYDFFLRCTELASKPEADMIRRYRDELLKIIAKQDAAGKNKGYDHGAQGDSELQDGVCEEEAPIKEAEPERLSGDRQGRTDIGAFKAAEGDIRRLSEASGLTEGSIRELVAGRFCSERIIHIPKVCYHWRYHRGSTASDPKSKLYAFEAGARAIKAHYERTFDEIKSLPRTVEKGVTYGYYHSIFDAAQGGGPLISVLIPNKDHIEDLKNCIGSIAERSTYKNIEFIIIENNSEKAETFAYYNELSKAGSIGGMPVKIVYWDREFNYSAINNFGASFAEGEYLLLLNNDVELREPDSIGEMMSYAMREDIGIVGARLCYPDDTIQHAGVIVGLGGIAGAAFVGSHEKENTYMHRMMSLQDLSSVTAACLLTRRSVFEAAGGLYEDLAVAFNDIDYCMKVRRLGYRCVYDPYAVFYHYESKSRGLEDTPEKVQRFNGEIAVFASRWGEILEKGDPYYNPNLTLRKANFALRDLTREKPGEPYKLELDVEKQLKTVLAEKRRRERTGA